MFLSNLLKRIQEKHQRKSVLRELIESLKIDETQRFLYLESLELLDDDGLSVFYQRLISFVDDTEWRHVINEGERRLWFVKNIREAERNERSKETDNVNFLFDSV